MTTLVKLMIAEGRDKEGAGPGQGEALKGPLD
jgi:hypothetical protein